MATNVTFFCYTRRPDGRTTERSGVLSLADVVVNTTPTDVGTFNTATVTADNQRQIYVNPTDAATAGVDPGWYNRINGANFRKAEINPR